MTVCWRAIVLCCWALICLAASAPSPGLVRNKYRNSFRLTRSTRTRVQLLLQKYKEQQLGNKDFEDRHRQLNGLPSLSTDLDRWLRLTDWDRLCAVLLDMQAYWEKLEWKKKQLEKEETEQREAQAATATLPQSIRHIQLDLKDLMSQVRSQISYMMKSFGVQPTSAPTQTPPGQDGGPKTGWDSRVEGYVILRDLDLYLTKLARDFLLLASNVHA